MEDIGNVSELDYDWKKLDGKTILISGGTGFIGSFFLDVIRYRNEKYNAGIKIISLSRRGGASDETVKYVKCDISNSFAIEDEVDYVLHLASNTHPKQYGEDPVGTIMTNVIGCDNLLKVAYEKKARFLLASSVEIYGLGDESCMNELYAGYINCNDARSGYNEAKRTCEALCQSYRKQYAVDVVIARFARIFGADHKKDTKAMAQFMDKAVAGEDIILKSKGTQRFSYCYVADAVSGLIKVLLDGENGEAYNIAADDEGKNLGEYAGYIAHLAGKDVIFEIVDDENASKASYALLDISKLQGLGWKPRYSVSEALERTYNIKRARDVR